MPAVDVSRADFYPNGELGANMARHFTRRDALKASAAMVACTALPSPGAALDPATFATAIKVGEFALGAARLLQGSSTSGPSDLQVRLLLNISKQLEVVKDGIVLILSRLEEIRQILDEVPAAVVQELSSRNLAGSFLTYRELISRFDALNQNLAAFRREKAQEVIRLAENVRDSSRILITYRNYTNIPILCSSLAVEYECRRLLGETDQQIQPIIDSYGAYFKTVLYEGDASLEKRIANLRSERAGYYKSLETPRMYKARTEISSYLGNSAQVALGWSKYTPKAAPEVYMKEVQELISLGLIEQTELPVVIEYTQDWRAPGNGRHGYLSTQLPPGNAGYEAIGSVPTPQQAAAEQKAVAQKEDDNLNLNARRLYAAVTCFHAGERSLNFCQQFNA